MKDWWQTQMTWRTYLLLPLSGLVAILTHIRRWLYRSHYLSSYRLPVPVLVVGNIVVGGTGKTPLVQHLVNQFRLQGRHPGIISRGYGRINSEGRVPFFFRTGNDDIKEVTADSTAQEVGDEPLLLALTTQVPVFIGSNRVATARRLLAQHPLIDILISDDGLQHYAMQADLYINIQDHRGYGNGCYLPAGPLREGLWRLSEMDIILTRRTATTHTNIISFADAISPTTWVGDMALIPQSMYSLQSPDQNISIDEWLKTLPSQSRGVTAVAGIGNPQNFFSLLDSLGITHYPHSFPDHYVYCPKDLSVLSASIIVMTEKDAMKCRGPQWDTWLHQPTAPRVWVLSVRAEVSPGLMGHITVKLNRLKEIPNNQYENAPTVSSPNTSAVKRA